ncbi:hypothetical protein M3G03_02835 [Aestuariimicrobium sp. p3-SID1156]|uniref:hypothetical protein n=1 Tax=Aestuariimicrobium sp. p3-SID1156 TaxID=2916038 RepID=UPI00223AC66D|nr:hypothetical protein [Aestuariimicrobium sp. p3-SID1156]MCT1458486.1 hypothetical protein [Aestuariimicrobium sp. p3-SID1156]
MDDIRAIILDRMQALAPALDEAMSAAITQTETRAAGFAHERFPHTRPMNVRQDVRLAREAMPNLAGWKVEGDPRKMGQLILEDSQTGISIRFLKSPYSQPDGIPHAGSNHARRLKWTNPRFEAPLPGMGLSSRLTSLEALAGTPFLLIWAYLDPAKRDAGYDLRIIHTLAPGRFGGATPCDLDLRIPRGGILREEDLRFVASENDEDLFVFDLPAEEEDQA